MVAASMGADVTIIERAGVGGSAVLTDVVPSKTLIATADAMNRSVDSAELGVSFKAADGDPKEAIKADLLQINERVLRLAKEQSMDIRRSLEAVGVNHQLSDMLIGKNVMAAVQHGSSPARSRTRCGPWNG